MLFILLLEFFCEAPKAIDANGTLARDLSNLVFFPFTKTIFYYR